jgi:hypothetical protein
LGRVTASGTFAAYNAGGSDGTQLVAAVCLNDTVILAGGGFAPVCKGEFFREGVAAVMAGLASPVTLDAPLIGQCWDEGIILN